MTANNFNAGAISYNRDDTLQTKPISLKTMEETRLSIYRREGGGKITDSLIDVNETKKNYV